MSTFLKYLESSPTALQSDKLSTRILPSLRVTLHRNAWISEIDEFALRLWAVDMFLSGLKYSTVRRYIGGLHTLYKEWSLAKGVEEDPFLSLQDSLIPSMEYSLSEHTERLRHLGRLFKKSANTAQSVYLQALLYLLYNIDSDYSDVIGLKYKDYRPSFPQLDDIVITQRRRPEAQYVFPLKQGKSTPKKITNTLRTEITEILNAIELRYPSQISVDELHALWLTAALKIGVKAIELRSLFPVLPDSYSCLRLLPQEPVASTRRNELMSQVADSLNPYASRWYVMRLRRGVSPEDIRQSVSEEFGELMQDLSYYYPTYTRTIKTDNKKVRHEEVAYLPGLLFFKLRSDKVGTLFSKIGHLAWCYRRNPRPDSPYCQISQLEMERFQRELGQLTPDVRLGIETNSLVYSKDSEVQIIGGGLLTGHIGVVQSVKDNSGTRTYTLRITESLGAVWTVHDIDEALLTPLQ